MLCLNSLTPLSKGSEKSSQQCQLLFFPFYSRNRKRPRPCRQLHPSKQRRPLRSRDRDQRRRDRSLAGSWRARRRSARRSRRSSVSASEPWRPSDFWRRSSRWRARPTTPGRWLRRSSWRRPRRRSSSTSSRWRSSSRYSRTSPPVGFSVAISQCSK